MKTKHLLLGLCIATMGVSMASAAVTRVWTDSQGRKVEATFLKLDGTTVYIQLLDGTVHSLPMDRLSSVDQDLVKKLPASENASKLTSLPPAASVAQAAAKIDQIVEMGIVRANPQMAELHQKEAAEMAKTGKTLGPFVPLKPNPMTTDEQFVRRIYLDIAGRIPTYDETVAFVSSRAADKRAVLINKLLDSEGYISHTYNYFAEMLRLTDRLNNQNLLRGLPYIQWLKDEVRANKPWDQTVYAMLTASGKMWHNGASGYLLRDSGMPLDNLANTLTVFLGTDVACAQCHDHPFADWTQRQFYEMAAFFGSTSTQMNRRDYPNGQDPRKRLESEITSILAANGKSMEQGTREAQRFEQSMDNIFGANRVFVNQLSENRTRLPHDYKYPDGKPGDAVNPKFIKWSEGDGENPAYIEGEKIAGTHDGKDPGNIEALREGFAKWAVNPSNPRFAMTIANRMWARAFGVALTPTVRNIDNPDEAYNPELLKHLANEMVRVKFDLKEFQRIIFNTKAYQREATTQALAMGMPYYFQGPVLRRMSAEQAWDSYLTLVMGNVDNVKNTEADLYGRSVDMDLTNPNLTGQTVLLKLAAVQTINDKQRERTMGGNLANMSGDDKDTKRRGRNNRSSSMMEEESSEMMDGTGSPGEGRILSYGNMKLMRASELEQPAPPGHFLREFGQSERNLIDGGSKEGSVPQVLMMMNGNAQQMLTSKDSLIFKTMDRVKTSSEKVETIFLSILNRRPDAREKGISTKQLNSYQEAGYANMIWALINTREFSFIQ